jgi:NADH-quinone oxidoreductase subunit C
MKRDVTQALLAQFGEDTIGLTDNFRGDVTFIIPAPQILEVCRFVKDGPGLEYKMLTSITAADYEETRPQDGRFSVVYHLASIKYNQRLRFKVWWSDGDDPIPSVTPLWKSANWEERETYDMFGIPFAGHPDLRRLLMPEDWQGHPLRRDYPLGYETVQFSFNFDEVSKHKPFARE